VTGEGRERRRSLCDVWWWYGGRKSGVELVLVWGLGLFIVFFGAILFIVTIWWRLHIYITIMWVYLSFFLKYNYCLLGLYRYFWPVIGSVFFQYMGMDQYLLIQFLVGWTSIYQLFWCSPGVQGFDTLPYIKNDRLLTDFRSAARWDASRSAKRIWRPSWQIASGILSDAEEIWGGLIVSDTLW